MTSGPSFARGILPLMILTSVAGIAPRAASAGQQGDALLRRALASELSHARDPDHPMRYQLRRSSPRLTTTKEIYETRDGAVARLMEVNDKPLSPAEDQKEQQRLDALLNNPSKQLHRKQQEEEDTKRVLKVLSLLPTAYIYTFESYENSSAGQLARYSFRPNPQFDPPDMETQVMSAMSGILLVNVAQERVVKLEGHLTRDVDFGWGILGRLYKGGWIVIEQADVGWNQWRIVRFRMQMSGRVLFKSKVFDTVQETSQFAPVPVGLSYVQAIKMLRAGPKGIQQAER